MTTRLPEDELRVLKDIKNCRILELGNKRNKTGTYREWYNNRGCEYMCLDWNTHDGAIFWDLREELNTKRDLNEEPFDVITNFGVTEHITVQEPAWRNIHNAVHVGGAMVHCGPYPFNGYKNKTPNWNLHGYWQPTLDWLNELSEANQYTIEILEENLNRVRPTLLARLIKPKDNEFVWIGDSGLHRTSLQFTDRDLKGWK